LLLLERKEEDDFLCFHVDIGHYFYRKELQI
jgi:hypothetical protein